MKLPRNLVEHLGKIGLSMADVAKKARISRGHLHDVLHWRRPPRLSTLARIAPVMQMSTTDLLAALQPSASKRVSRKRSA